MRNLILCVSVILVLLVALSDGRSDCCEQYQPDPIRVKYLKHYRIQEVTGHCNFKAIIFKTRKNRILCGDPNEKWVKKAMKSVPKSP